MNNIKKLNKKGFTLTELIVVIVIIGILAAVLIPTLTGYIKKANESADEQELRNLNVMVELLKYEDEKPSTVTELKDYLKENDYKGDYSLRIKDSYLWFNTDSMEFVIISAEELAAKQASANSLKVAKTDLSKYTVASELTEPEGLLSVNNKPVWLIGGNGNLVEAVSNLRNLADETKVAINDRESTLKAAFTAYNELGFGEKLINFIENVKFNAGNGSLAYTMTSDGTATLVENATRENTIYAEVFKLEGELLFRKKFHEDVILKYLPEINNLLKEEEEAFAEIKIINDNVDGSYDVHVIIHNQNKTLADAVPAFSKLLEYLAGEEIKKGYLIPKDITPEQFVQHYKDKMNVEEEMTVESLEINLNDQNQRLITFAQYILIAAYFPNVPASISPTDKFSTLLVDGDTPFQLTGYNEDKSHSVIYNFEFVSAE